MDLAFTPEELGFREEIRAWVHAHLPQDIAHKVHNALQLTREDMQRWGQILGKKGWLGHAWPKEFGGPGWNAIQKHLFEEECALAGAPRVVPFGPVMVAPVIMAFGNAAQQQRFLPGIASGEVWWSQGYSEPGSGSDLASLKTRAERHGDKYIVNGQKTWTTLGQFGEWIFCLVRTSSEGKPQTGISFLLIDMKTPGLTVRPIRNMVNHETNELFIDNLEIPAANLIGEEGKGFKYILDGLNAERILIAAECIGDGYWFIDKGTAYAKERVVFDRPIGKNQGVQFPLARAYVNVEAANLMRFKAAALFDAGQACGAEANMAKLLAADASWEAANVCLQTHGGFGFAAEYDVERKFRETRLYQVAPISTNLILSYIGEHVLGMPRSF